MTQTFFTPSNPRLKKNATIFTVVLGTLLCGSTALSAQTVNPNPVDLAGHGRTQGVEILTDTRGVDFAPYIHQILRLDSSSWHKLLGQDTGAPTSQGWTLIRLTIASDGTVSAMHLDDSSHQTALDRAAWGSITSIGKLPPLPKDFNGPSLELRLRFNVSSDAVK
jgi:TonB family protein